SKTISTLAKPPVSVACGLSARLSVSVPELANPIFSCCVYDFEVRIIIERYRLLGGKIVGHGLKQLLAFASSARPAYIFAVPAFASTAIPFLYDSRAILDLYRIRSSAIWPAEISGGQKLAPPTRRTASIKFASSSPPQRQPPAFLPALSAR